MAEVFDNKDRLTRFQDIGLKNERVDRVLVGKVTSSNDCVILLHGLARTRRSFVKMARALDQRDYEVFSSSYASREKTIEELSVTHIRKELEKTIKFDKVHFVTHSMGGILLRHYLSLYSISKLGRVVMLGPPNKGSQVVDKLRRVPGFAFFNGPAGLQLGTESGSVPNRLGPANFEVGVIAGTRSINLLLSLLLPGPNDGKVTVESTKLEGMKEHIDLPVAHPIMMNNSKVIESVFSFLDEGRFTAQ